MIQGTYSRPGDLQDFRCRHDEECDKMQRWRMVESVAKH